MNEVEMEHRMTCVEKLAASNLQGASANFDGVFTFFGDTYTINTTDDTVTFYRHNLSGVNATDWEVVQGNFNKAQSSLLLS